MRCIYKILNGVNGKFYVGSAVNFVRRKRAHLSKLRRGIHGNFKLQGAWKKHGEAAFAFVVVQEIATTEDLLAAENIWLTEHVGKPYCYNIARDASAPGLGTFGSLNPCWGKRFSHTPEAKALISAAAKARVQTEEEKAKRRQTMQGHAVSIETREKISASLSGANNPYYGKSRTEDFKKKVRKSVEAISPDGRVLVYPSIQELRERGGLKPPTINRALKSGKPLTRGPNVGWSFRYADTMSLAFPPESSTFDPI
jgi:group I intron endonuclease